MPTNTNLPYHVRQANALAEMNRTAKELGRPLFDGQANRILRAHGIDPHAKVACP